jgi:hypothetical protein
MSLTVHELLPNRNIFSLNTGNIFYFENNSQPYIITYAGGQTMQYQKYSVERKKGYGEKNGTSKNIKIIVFSKFTQLRFK